MNTAISNSRSKSRDHWSDLLKTIAIFGVVWIHVTAGDGPVAAYFRFCVPAFVTLWAMYLEKGLQRTPPDQQQSFLFQRAIRLIVPYVFWTLIYAIVRKATQSNLDGTTEMVFALKALAGKGWMGQYFLLVLLQLMLIVPVLRQSLSPWITWLLILIGGILYACFDYSTLQVPGITEIGHRAFVYWLPFAVIGIGLSRSYFRSVPKVVAGMIAVVALSLAPWEQNWVQSYLPRSSPYILLSVYVASVALMLAWPIQTSTTMGPTTASSAGLIVIEWLQILFDQIGSRTFPIYLMNPLVIPWLPQRSYFGVAGQLEIAFDVAAVIVVCLFLGQLFRKLRLGILIGG